MKFSAILRRLGVAHDIVAATVAFYLSYLIVLGRAQTMATPGIYEKSLIFVISSSVVFYFFSLNRGAWRYASIPDLISIVKSATIISAGYVVSQFVYIRGENLPRTVPVLIWLFLIINLGGPRLIYRIIKEGGLTRAFTGIHRPHASSKHVLILGMTEVAGAYIRSVQTHQEHEIFIAGIVDDSLKNISKQMHGKRVLGTSFDLLTIKAQLAREGINAAELIIAGSLISKDDLSQLLERATQAGLKLSRLPIILQPLSIDEKLSILPKPVEISDLLNRPEISFKDVEVIRLIEAKTVLVTGAGGSIGSELIRQIAAFNPKEVVLCDMSEHFLYTIHLEMDEKHPELKFVPRIMDVRSESRVRAIFEEFRPDIVFHAAALKHVPLMEENVLEAINTNVLGTKICADAAAEFKTKRFVMISTDKAVNPTNVMGATKRAAEAYCQSLDLRCETTRFKTVRFGNVLGSNGSVVPRFAAQIAKGGPVTVTHPEVLRYFMTIPEAVALVLQASSHGDREMSERGKILVLDMGEPVLVAELAKRMIQLAGFRPGIDIQIKYTGLRPGEKLFEELFDPKEILEEHQNTIGYKVASPRLVDMRIMELALKNFSATTTDKNSNRGFTLLRKIVPEFHHPHYKSDRNIADVIAFPSV